MKELTLSMWTVRQVRFFNALRRFDFRIRAAYAILYWGGCAVALYMMYVSTHVAASKKSFLY